MRIAVVGTGGVGGYFGGRLAQAGHEVHFIARGSHLVAIREHGLRVESIGGDFAVHPALATDDPAKVGSVDDVIVAVKAWQLADVVEGPRALVGPETVVLPLLNGVEASERLAGALGSEHVLGGSCRIGAEIAGPGRIRHHTIDPSIIAARCPERAPLGGPERSGGAAGCGGGRADPDPCIPLPRPPSSGDGRTAELR